MEARQDTPKERQRLLRLFVERPAQLHLPLTNRALLAMLDEGQVAVTHRWREQMLDCVKIRLTEAGRKAMASP